MTMYFFSVSQKSVDRGTKCIYYYARLCHKILFGINFLCERFAKLEFLDLDAKNVATSNGSTEQ